MKRWDLQDKLTGELIEALHAVQHLDTYQNYAHLQQELRRAMDTLDELMGYQPEQRTA